VRKGEEIDQRTEKGGGEKKGSHFLFFGGREGNTGEKARLACETREKEGRGVALFYPSWRKEGKKRKKRQQWR